MAVKLTDPTTKESDSLSFGIGVFVNKAVIEEIEDVSGEEVGKNGYIPEIGLKLTLNIGQEFKPKLFLFGKYDRDKNGEIKGWKKYNDVGIFLSRVLGDEAEINDDFTIPQAVIDKLKFKEIWRLSYCAGSYNDRPSFNTFGRIANVNTPPEDLFKEFENRMPWIKDYTPDVWEAHNQQKEDNATSFKKEEFAETVADDVI